MMNIITKCHERKKKKSQTFLAEIFIDMYQHSLMGLAIIVNNT